MKLIIQILLLILFNACCLGQDFKMFSVKVEDSRYYIGNTEFNTTSIVIKNTSSKDIVFWLSDKNVQNMASKEKIKDYFFQVKGDFSLAQLMTDNIASLPSPVLYVSFLKYLAPDESFSINVLTKGILGEEQKMKIENYLTNRINGLDIESFNNFIENDVLKSFSYKDDSICLALESL
ncbi:MAG: hypothetical protein PHG14_16560 [Desulfobacter postgatei]|uniref:hypothetical protein n=1 Tax=Desulfobacter postgatei TaxID=2293 RepID=UPI0023F4E12C|nr:hypothetical protein [Desulfobacter postgatei]MDD4275325.1 hypothetical protein [Desulfobacter postgatei]